MCAFSSVIFHSCSTQRLGRLVRQGVTRPVFRCLQLLVIMVDLWWYMLTIHDDSEWFEKFVRSCQASVASRSSSADLSLLQTDWRSPAMIFLVQSWSQEETVVAIEKWGLCSPAVPSLRRGFAAQARSQRQHYKMLQAFVLYHLHTFWNILNMSEYTMLYLKWMLHLSNGSCLCCPADCANWLRSFIACR